MIDRDNIIRMAREAGLAPLLRDTQKTHEALERLAALVRAAALEEAAEVCDNSASHCHDDGLLQLVLKSNAAAIRARSST